MSKMTLEKWYGSSVHIPSYNSYYFSSFIASSMGIVKSIVRRQMNKDIRVVFANVGTAQADQESGKIVIDQNYLEGKYHPQKPKLEAGDAITMMLGLQVHEAAHFAWSPATLTPFGDYIKKHSPQPFVKEVAHTLGNIVEDIFIEAQVDRVIPWLTWMLDRTNDILFDYQDRQDIVDAVQGVTSAPKSVGQLEAVMDYLILAKIRSTSKMNPWLDDMFSRARSATEISDITGRYELTLDLYNRLMELVPVQKMIVPPRFKKAPLQGGFENEQKSMAKAPYNPKSAEVTKLGEMTNDKLERLKNTEVSIETMPSDSGEDVAVIFYERFVGVGTGEVPIDRRYERLAEIARQRATTNRPYGMDMNRGHHIRRLYRIQTDQKIFAEPVASTSFKPMEVIILVDWSGSMQGVALDQAAQAAAGAAMALTQARCQVAVYGHTADVTGNDVVIYKFKDFNEPVEILPRRLFFGKATEQCGQNRDGDAIDYVSKKFPASNRRQLLIVISDGRPNAEGCKGEFAVKYTQSKVDALRQRGVAVLSISIKPTAAEVNNRIYGEKNNVFNTDVNIIADVVHNLLTS